MIKIKYLSIDEVLAIHYEMIRQFGGKEGISNFNLLHSAVERCKVTFDGKELYQTIFEKSAALVQSLIQNHPFADGNKRTAIVCCARFLFINSYKLQLPTGETYDFCLSIATASVSFEDILKWIETNSKIQTFI